MCLRIFTQLVYVRVCSRMCMNEQDTHVMTQLVYVRVCLRMCMNVLLDCCLGGARNISTPLALREGCVGWNCCAHLPSNNQATIQATIHATIRFFLGRGTNLLRGYKHKQLFFISTKQNSLLVQEKRIVVWIVV